jgi:Na+/pantothenate symporter
MLQKHRYRLLPLLAQPRLTMVSLSTGVALFLGLFEFWMVIKSEVLHDYSSIQALKVYPASFVEDRSTHLIVMAFTVFLGLLRISWAVSGRTIGSWLCLIFTHVAESVFLWNLALGPHWNKNKVDIVGLFKEIIAKKHDIPSSVLLFLVPGIALFFLLCGHGISNTRKEKRS